jgi:pyridoxamine 5'-phosphate oxidase
MEQNMDFSTVRNEYQQMALDENTVLKEPLKQIALWLEDAHKAGCLEYTAMSLATVGANGQPSVRKVLLKYLMAEGLCFFTNYESRKAIAIDENPKVAALLFWPELERQVNIEGEVVKVSAEISDAYFHERPFDSQISARVSNQSSFAPDRKSIEQRWKTEAAQWGNKLVERPSYWGGYQIVPQRIEFWQGRPHRLHDRIVFQLIDNKWNMQRLYP